MAYRYSDEEEAEIRRNFLSNISRSYEVNFPFTYPTNPHTFKWGNVDMVIGNKFAARESSDNYAAFQMNLERGKTQDVKCREQMATYYIGAVSCLIPEVTQDILQGLGIRSTVRTLNVPSGASSSGTVIPHEKANAFFGYLVIMLCKNVTKENFVEFSDRCLKALFDAAGYVPKDGEGFSVFNDVKHAIDYRYFCQIGRVREAVLRCVLKHSKVQGSFGQVCLFVAKKLSWMGMTGFCKVYKMLVLTESAVLTNRGMMFEVGNLQRAVKAVFDTEMPQYFRILKSHPDDYTEVASSKFPTLIAVAERIILSTNETFRLSEVDYYVAIHNKQFERARSARLMLLVDDIAQVED